ncbi:MAG TPA: hypothetical protein P5042_03210 [Candidatus Izemoplasmatales bacterium]|nr:hypothetical protein [Candidatus Izemoplasmatales bacterium]
MKNNVTKNVTLAQNENVAKSFPKLKARKSFCQIMLTTKRLIIYSNGPSYANGRKVKRKSMNEIDLNSIHNYEYYVDRHKHSLFVRILGFLFVIAALAVAYFVMVGKIVIASYPYSDIGNYVVLGLAMLLGFLMMFSGPKTLTVDIMSGMNNVTTLALIANRYNELAVRYIGSKIHPLV